MINWIEIDSVEEIDFIGGEVLVYDGADCEVDFVDVCVDTGCLYMANGMNPTHYAIINRPNDDE